MIGAHAAVRRLSAPTVASLRRLDGDAMRSAHWARRKTDDGITAEETASAGEHSSASGRVYEAGETEVPHITVPTAHDAAVESVRLHTAVLADILGTSNATVQYKLSDVAPYTSATSDVQPFFTDCAVGNRIAALNKGDGGLLELLGLKGPWQRDPPGCTE